VNRGVCGRGTAHAHVATNASTSIAHGSEVRKTSA